MDIPGLTVMFFIIINLCSVHKITSIKCYICGDNIDGQNVPCENIKGDDPKFMKDCGVEGKSCRSEREVTKNVFLSRTCANVILSDCKVANSIEFCYCTRNLCNFLNPFEDNEEGDDESFEGSGVEMNTSHHDNTDIEIKLTQTVKENVVPAVSLCSISQFSIYLLSFSTVFYVFLSLEGI